MHFNSFSDFLAMGGHAFYVWWSYGITFVLLSGLCLVSVLRKKSLLTKINQQHKHEQALKKIRKDKQKNES